MFCHMAPNPVSFIFIFFLLSPHLARPDSSDHRVLLLWRPPQLSAQKKRVLSEFPCWGQLLLQRLEPDEAYKVSMCVC